MKETIVVTDGYTLNPGDLSWKRLEKFGKVTYYERTSPEEVISRCKKASVIVTNKTPITAKTIDSCSSLKVILVTATGYNIVDLNAAKMKGVLVCNVPGYGTDSVAQHTFALILELTNHVGKNNAAVKQGDWVTSPDFCFTTSPILELAGKRLGIVGFGKIGQEVVYHSPSYPKKDTSHVSLHELFSTSDIISLHCPLRADNHGFVNRDLLILMKESALLINTSRGQLVDEADLAHALKHKLLTGAAVDVLSKEPPQSDHPLIGLPNCIITPHTAWLTFEARERIMKVTADNLAAALRGTPQNSVA
jgi:glycerate dehydrogenase